MREKPIAPILAKLRASLSISWSSPDLIRAQCAALSRLIPLMYLILLANTWVLAVIFLGRAPAWLAICCPLLLTLACAIRLAAWRRTRGLALTTEEAARALRRTNLVAGFLAVGFCAWALALFPYGDALAQSHVAFYLAVAVIGSGFCLMHLRSAALIVTGVVSSAFIGFFATTGNPIFMAMALNVLLATAAMLTVLLFQSRDFDRMIATQAEAMALIAENRRREQEQSRLARMIDDMPVAVMTVDPATFRINYANETSRRTLAEIEDLLPIRADQLLGTSIDVFHPNPEHQRALLADPARLPHHARIRLGPEVLDLQISAVTAADGSYIGPMLTWSIVTQQVEAEDRIRQLAHYDALTGLANRATFRERLEASLARPGHQVALLFIDLDGFKIINDSRGHLFGDVLLRRVADRIRATCDQPDMTVARLGGDEFAILLEQGDPDRAAALAGALVLAIAAPYHPGGDRHVQIGASIGIAFAPRHGEDAETLLSRADIALFSAKTAGRGTFRIFTPEMETRIQDRVRLDARLRVALEARQGLFVFYQPIVDVRTGRITAREALLRWHHPQRGWISPGEFIPVAEESGLIERLGVFVLHRACRDALGWADGARVAVNVSAAQLGRGTLPSVVLAALDETGLPPGRLEIEITETVLLTGEGDSVAELHRLRDLGVRVALDDFGTGFSSLAHLRAFHFDKIKIDSSFVRDAVERADCAAIVKAIADLGTRLDVTTVAEGVETADQLALVTAEGCSEVQGFLFGRPLPDEADAAVVDALNDATPGARRETCRTGIVLAP